MISMSWPQYLRHQCSKDGHPIHLTRKETQVLSTLLLCRDSFVSIETLLENMYKNVDVEPDWAITCLRVYVCSLRKKLGRKTIVNDHYRGYMIPNREILYAA